MAISCPASGMRETGCTARNDEALACRIVPSLSTLHSPAPPNAARSLTPLARLLPSLCLDRADIPVRSHAPTHLFRHCRPGHRGHHAARDEPCGPERVRRDPAGETRRTGPGTAGE